jgi:hypothetical protein
VQLGDAISAVTLFPWMRPLICTTPFFARAEALKTPSAAILPIKVVANRGT